MKKHFLSYVYEEKIPTYGQVNTNIECNRLKDISKGDSCNVFDFKMENHWGTHVDCPAHFFDNGKKVSEYEADEWIFYNPQVIHVSLEENELISCSHLNEIKEDTDLLLIKTGFCFLRDNDKYALNNPGFLPEAGEWIQTNYPSVKAIGFDFVSLSSFQNRLIGRAAHKAFLGPNNPIRIIEDMDLSVDMNNLKEVWVMPLRIRQLDSSPCTVIGVFNDD